MKLSLIIHPLKVWKTHPSAMQGTVQSGRVTGLNYDSSVIPTYSGSRYDILNHIVG